MSPHSSSVDPADLWASPDQWSTDMFNVNTYMAMEDMPSLPNFPQEFSSTSAASPAPADFGSGSSTLPEFEDDNSEPTTDDVVWSPSRFVYRRIPFSQTEANFSFVIVPKEDVLQVINVLTAINRSPEPSPYGDIRENSTIQPRDSFSAQTLAARDPCRPMPSEENIISSDTVKNVTAG